MEGSTSINKKNLRRSKARIIHTLYGVSENTEKPNDDQNLNIINNLSIATRFDCISSWLSVTLAIVS